MNASPYSRARVPVVSLAVFAFHTLELRPTSGTIRRVDPGGTITTFAATAGYSGDEGAAASAELSSANGIVGDLHGNVDVTQGANDVVRRPTREGRC